MGASRPKSIASILGQKPDSLLQRLHSQQVEHHTLLGYLRTNLPNKQASHLVAVNCREEVLVLIADGPAWANLIRYQTTKLLKRLHTDAKEFGNIKTDKHFYLSVFIYLSFLNHNYLSDS